MDGTLTALDQFRPLVVGAPRSGFALLTSVVIHLMPFARSRWTVAENVTNAILEGTDLFVADAIVREFQTRGITDDLVFNGNFRRLTGGPKWLREDDREYACFRKYIGVRGMGDFTLITSHPRQVLDSDEVVHSHTNPELWLRHPGYADYTKFASVRNPVGILNSSVFSINALASEYIQKFIPPDADNDEMRQRLALYKLTDLAFVRGLVEFLVGYLNDFVRHWRQYHILRWEDLILTPVPSIMRLAHAVGIPIREEQARRIWSILDHVNLTGHHRHNYRAGKGIVGNWRKWLVNEHLELFEQMGLEPFMLELGYGPMPRLREAEYTPFQRKVRDFIGRGEICRETDDLDLFTFAFNKSNIVSQEFPFRRRPWRRWTRIERSIFTSEELELAISDVAEHRTQQVNAMLEDLLALREASLDELRAAVRSLPHRHDEIFAHAPKRMNAAVAKAVQILERARAADPPSTGRSIVPAFHHEPRLIDTRSGFNVVAYGERYFGIPHRLGEVQVDERTASHPDVISGNTLTDVTNEIVLRQGTLETPSGSAPIAGPELTFVDPIPEAVAALCRQRLDEGCRQILLTPFNDFAHRVYHSIRADAAAVGGQLLVPASDGHREPPEDVRRANVMNADLVLVCETEEPQLSDALLDLVDCNARVVAVKTTRFWAEQPLFLISIPKSGTHLLYRLAEALGYRAAVHLQDDPAPAHWYCVEYTNSHTSAKDFFIDTVRRAPYGNRHHPFMRSPAIFIYRNPLDIVASEAHYYHRDGKTAFSGYFAALGSEDRLLRLIDDPWLLGSIRDRIGAFLPWLELPNVIPVSFEELVGPRGGGDANEQRRAIWSIQLKLHVPGDPDAFAAEVFDPRSPTFDTGRIGRFRDVFSDEAYRRIRALPQDFLEQYGYEGSIDGTSGMPRRAGEFRRRRLQLSSAVVDVPIAVQYSYLGYNIVRFGDSYIGVMEGDESHLETADLRALEASGAIVIGRTAAEVRRGIETRTVQTIVSRQPAGEPRLTQNEFDAPSALRAELEATNRRVDDIRAQLAILQTTNEKLRLIAVETAADLERGAARERKLRQQVAVLLDAISTREHRANELTAEATEMRKWIRQLHAELAKRS